MDTIISGFLGSILKKEFAIKGGYGRGLLEFFFNVSLTKKKFYVDFNLFLITHNDGRTIIYDINEP